MRRGFNNTNFFLSPARTLVLKKEVLRASQARGSAVPRA